MKLTKFRHVKIGNCVMGYDPDGVLVVGGVTSKMDSVLHIGESMEVERITEDGKVKTNVTICSANRIHSNEFIYVIDLKTELTKNIL